MDSKTSFIIADIYFGTVQGAFLSDNTLNGWDQVRTGFSKTVIISLDTMYWILFVENALHSQKPKRTRFHSKETRSVVTRDRATYQLLLNKCKISKIK